MTNTLPRLSIFAHIAAVLLGASVLSACGTNSIVANAAKAAFEDRLAEEQVVDAKIKTRILDNNLDIDKALLLDLSIDVWKTRVMITGALTDADQRSQIARAALKDKRIGKLYNEIQVVSTAELKQRREWRDKAEAGVDKAAEVIDDFWIETKISAQLITTDNVSSVNYRWRAVLGTVYVIGEAQTAQELKTVLNVIKNIKGVKAVRNHIQVRG